MLLTTPSSQALICSTIQESARLIIEMTKVPAILIDCHEMSLPQLQYSPGKCADELEDALDRFEKLHDQLRSYRKSQVADLPGSGEDVTKGVHDCATEYNACTFPLHDHQVIFPQRSDSSAAADTGLESNFECVQFMK